MCWSFEVSLGTLVWSWSVSALCFWRNSTHRDRWNAITLAAFSSMQLVEALLWWDFGRCPVVNECGCTDFNFAVTQIAVPLTLVLEPLAALYGGGKKLTSPLMKGKWTRILVGVTWFNTAAIMVRGIFLKWRWACTTISPSGHLLWWGRMVCFLLEYSVQVLTTTKLPLSSYFLFIIVMTYPFLLGMRPFLAGVLYSGILWGSWTYGLLTDSNGSNWCLWANLFSLLALVDPYVFKTPQTKGKQSAAAKKKRT
ncbi:hypothetical protein Pelo_12564 [Pelomyxa schiedti]|nr:hypothetical protein Pelo_12564 [Pelomyxa schiedti]